MLALRTLAPDVILRQATRGPRPRQKPQAEGSMLFPRNMIAVGHDLTARIT